MRVATRQLRSVLHGFSRILGREQTQADRRRAEMARRAAGRGTDTEVMIERFTQVIRGLPEHLIMGPLASDLERSLGQLVEQGEQTIMAALDSDRYVALQHSLDALLEHPPLTRKAERPAQTELPRAVAKAFRKLDQQLDEFTALPPPGPRQRTARGTQGRQAGRYMTEVAARSSGPRARRLRKQTKKLQTCSATTRTPSSPARAAPTRRRRPRRRTHAFTYGVLLRPRTRPHWNGFSASCPPGWTACTRTGRSRGCTWTDRPKGAVRSVRPARQRHGPVRQSQRW